MMLHYNLSQILQMENRQRANLINSLTGFKSTALIGTTDENSNSNLAIFNSLVHLGAHPPLIGFIVRPDSVDRHTLSNILETKFYTINHINEKIYKQAHQTSARYPKEISEFKVVGLTEEYKNNFIAPFVQESSLQIAVTFKQRIDININDTILIIGQIEGIYFPKNIICEDGFLDLEKAGTITSTGLDSYHKTKRIARLSYAKPNNQSEEIKLNFIHNQD